jgi:hypothetical protein
LASRIDGPSSKTVGGVHDMGDGVSNCGICDQLLRMLDGDLAYHDHGAATVPVDVEQVAARRRPPII